MQSCCNTSTAQPQTPGSGSSIAPHPRYENPISLWNTNVWTKKAEWGDPDWVAVSRQEPPGQSCRAGTGEARTPGKWWLGWPQDSLLAAGISIPLHANAGLAYRDVSWGAVKLSSLQRTTKRHRYCMTLHKREAWSCQTLGQRRLGNCYCGGGAHFRE